MARMLKLVVACAIVALAAGAPKTHPHGSYCGSYQDIIKGLKIAVGSTAPANKVRLTQRPTPG